jgi:hypothetical protein
MISRIIIARNYIQQVLDETEHTTATTTDTTAAAAAAAELQTILKTINEYILKNCNHAWVEDTIDMCCGEKCVAINYCEICHLEPTIPLKN